MAASIEHTCDQAELDFLWLELTAKCNLNCVHCYADSSPSRPLTDGMTSAHWRELMREASELGCTKLQFIGGEPTLHPDLAALVEYAREQGFEFVEVYTNGTHLTPELKAAFVRHRINLAVSVYASAPGVHDSVTQRSGSHARTIGAIDWAVRAGLPVRASIIEMGANAGQTEATRELLASMGVRDIGTDRVRGIGRGAGEVRPESSMRELCGQCWRGKLCVSPRGEAYPCVFSRFCSLGSTAGGLRPILTNATLHGFRDAVRLQQQTMQAVGDECSPFEPPVCPPNRTICGPDLPSPPPPPPPPCGPDCAPNACTPQIA